MSFPALQGQDLIAWVERTAARWRDHLLRHPDALGFECDIRETSNVAGVLQHIVAVELRYAERLSGLQETPYDEIRYETTEEIYLVHEHAMHLVHALRRNSDSWWDQVIEFATRSGGTMQASRCVVLIHLLMHSIRHYAQLATIARQHGISCGWMMDYLDMRT